MRLDVLQFNQVKSNFLCTEVLIDQLCRHLLRNLHMSVKERNTIIH